MLMLLFVANLALEALLPVFTQSQITSSTHHPLAQSYSCTTAQNTFTTIGYRQPTRLKSLQKVLMALSQARKLPTACGLSPSQNQYLLHVKLPLHPNISFYTQPKHQYCAELYTTTDSYCERSLSRCTTIVNHCRDSSAIHLKSA